MPVALILRTRVSEADPSSGALTSTEVRVEAMCSEMLNLRSRAIPTTRPGTISVEKSERLSRELEKKGVPHEVLNAKQHTREA